jgi:tetratricopeptide (TPR) repeat protein
MPVSTSVHITHCLQYIISLGPRSILDVGCGFGLWGFLCREYLDVMEERVQPGSWRVRIDGIELFEPYIQAHQRALYSSIRIGDIREMASQVDEYELIIAGDVIEHLEKDEGERVVDQLYEKATRALLVNIPLGEGWDHPERHGNPGELHRSQWTPEDFLAYPNISQHFELPAGAYGSFFCPKDCTVEQRVAALLQAANYARSVDRIDRAIAYLRKGHALNPRHRDTVLFLSDTLLAANHAQAAVEVLERAVQHDEDFHFAFLALARLLQILKRPDDARTYASALLAKSGVEENVRSQTRALMEARY